MKYRVGDDGAVLEQTTYTWDGGRPTERTTRHGTTHWTYRPGTDIPLTRILDRDGVGREFVALVTDLVGAPVQLLTESGTVTGFAKERGLSPLNGAIQDRSDALITPGHHADRLKG